MPGSKGAPSEENTVFYRPQKIPQDTTRYHKIPLEIEQFRREACVVKAAPSEENTVLHGPLKIPKQKEKLKRK